MGRTIPFLAVVLLLICPALVSGQVNEIFLVRDQIEYKGAGGKYVDFTGARGSVQQNSDDPYMRYVDDRIIARGQLQTFTYGDEDRDGFGEFIIGINEEVRDDTRLFMVGPSNLFTYEITLEGLHPETPFVGVHDVDQDRRNEIVSFDAEGHLVVYERDQQTDEFILDWISPWTFEVTAAYMGNLDSDKHSEFVIGDRRGDIHIIGIGETAYEYNDTVPITVDLSDKGIREIFIGDVSGNSVREIIVNDGEKVHVVRAADGAILHQSGGLGTRVADVVLGPIPGRSRDVLVYGNGPQIGYLVPNGTAFDRHQLHRLDEGEVKNLQIVDIDEDPGKELLIGTSWFGDDINGVPDGTFHAYLLSYDLDRKEIEWVSTDLKTSLQFVYIRDIDGNGLLDVYIIDEFRDGNRDPIIDIYWLNALGVLPDDEDGGFITASVLAKLAIYAGLVTIFTGVYLGVHHVMYDEPPPLTKKKPDSLPIRLRDKIRELQ